MRGRGSRRRGGGLRTALERGRPQKFASYGIALWVRGSLGITIGTGVSAWADQWTGAHNLTQGTAANQPALITSGTLTGQPTVRCDGINDFLQTAGFTLNQPFTLLSTLKIITAGVGAANDIAFDGIATTVVVSTDAPTGYYIYAGAAAVSVGPANNPATGVFHFMSHIFNGASSFIFTDGALKASGNPGAGNPGGVTVGALANGTRPSNTEYEEILILNAAIGDSARQRWQNGARARCGI